MAGTLVGETHRVAARAVARAAHPEGVLAIEEGQRVAEQRHVARRAVVRRHHLREHRRLRAVHVVAAAAVGHEAERLDVREQILDGAAGGGVEAGDEEPLVDPVHVPVVALAEPPARHDRRVAQREQRVALLLLAHLRVDAPKEERPDRVEVAAKGAELVARDVVRKLRVRHKVHRLDVRHVHAGRQEPLVEEGAQRLVARVGRQAAERLDDVLGIGLHRHVDKRLAIVKDARTLYRLQQRPGRHDGDVAVHLLERAARRKAQPPPGRRRRLRESGGRGTGSGRGAGRREHRRARARQRRCDRYKPH